MFLHIALALALLLGMWVHVQRLAHPVTRPPRSVGFPIALALLALALLVPAPLHESGDPTRVGATLAFDWFFLAALPLAVAAPVATWFALALVTSALGLLPWLWLAPRHGLVRADTATGTGATAPLAWSAPARVDPDHCNGCGLCVADCPYGALVLAAVPDAGRRRPRALVRESMCASCGICAGSCPSATPLRGPVISSGIDLPDAPLQALRDALVSGLAKMRGSGTSSRPNADMVVAFVCEHGARPPASDRVLALPLRCAAQLPPSFVELALREGAGGVVVSRCAAGDCEFRLGARWVGMRIAAQREPRLRANVPAGRLMLVDASPGDEALLARELTAIAARASADVRAGNAGAPEQTNG